MHPKQGLDLAKAAFKEWRADKATRLGAALSYYTVFSLAPLLVIIIAIAGFVFGRQAVEGQLVGQIEGLVGPAGAQLIQTMIVNASESGTGILATVIGIGTLLLGATGVFGELKDALNTIWDAPKKAGGGILGMLKDRFLSFSMVFGIGFLLAVSLALSAALTAATNFLGGMLPVPGVVLQIVNFVMSFALITLLFAMIYKVLPDVEIAWRDVWIGAAVTSLLFAIGKQLIGLYLGYSSAGSVYGAAGSLAILLLWIYYSAQIFFLGAEFTKVYAQQYGSRVSQPGGAAATAEHGRPALGPAGRDDRERAETRPIAELGAKGWTAGRREWRPAAEQARQAAGPRRPSGQREHPVTALEVAAAAALGLFRLVRRTAIR